MSLEFSHRSLHGAKAGRRRLLFATLFVIVVFIADVATAGSVRGFVRAGAAALWQGTTRVRAGIFESGYFSTRNSLAKANSALREELAQYKEKAAGYDVLTSENAQLRSMLQLSHKERGITAPIVSSLRSSPYGTFTIGAGTSDAVVKGDIVLTEGGFVVGVVSDVQMRTTQARAVLSSGRVTDAIIGGSAVVVTGDGGGNAHAEIPRGIEVRERESVFAPEFGSRPIGIVGKVISSPTSAEQTIYIHLPLNFDAMRYVYIVHPR